MSFPTPILAITVALALLAAPPLPAQEARPTEASVRRMLAAAHLDTILDTYSAQIETSMRTSMQRELAGQTLNPEQSAIMNQMQDKVVALMREEMDWKRMEPQIIELYRNTFSQREVNGMLSWYTSPTGKAVVAKMPVITQQIANYGQARVQDVVPRLMQLQKDTVAQLKAAAPPPEASAH
jgi:uncharacterized protein